MKCNEMEQSTRAEWEGKRNERNKRAKLNEQSVHSVYLCSIKFGLLFSFFHLYLLRLVDSVLFLRSHFTLQYIFNLVLFYLLFLVNERSERGTNERSEWNENTIIFLGSLYFILF